jgi:hypothetical protein
MEFFAHLESLRARHPHATTVDDEDFFGAVVSLEKEYLQRDSTATMVGMGEADSTPLGRRNVCHSGLLKTGRPRARLPLRGLLPPPYLCSSTLLGEVGRSLSRLNKRGEQRVFHLIGHYTKRHMSQRGRVMLPTSRAHFVSPAAYVNKPFHEPPSIHPQAPINVDPEPNDQDVWAHQYIPTEHYLEGEFVYTFRRTTKSPSMPELYAITRHAQAEDRRGHLTYHHVEFAGHQLDTDPHLALNELLEPLGPDYFIFREHTKLFPPLISQPNDLRAYPVAWHEDARGEWLARMQADDRNWQLAGKDPAATRPRVAAQVAWLHHHGNALGGPRPPLF